MKRKFQLLLIGIATILLSSCENAEGGMGKVSFNVSQQNTVTDITKSSVSSYTTLPSVEDFTITIEDSNGESISVSDPNALTTLKAGNYTAKTVYGSVSEEGFDKPCFIGEQQFTINGGESISVNIKASLANCLIRMEYTDNFKNYYSDYSFTLTTGRGAVINFPADENRATFVDAYLVRVKGELVNQGGKTQSFSEKEYRNLAAATCYTMKFDASNIGSASITISFNNNLETVELGEFDLNE